MPACLSKEPDREIWPELFEPDFAEKYHVVKHALGDVSPLPFHYNDGGRKAAGFGLPSRDCVARSIAIASGLAYQDVYTFLAEQNALQRASKNTPKRQRSADDGIFTRRAWFNRYLVSLGFKWTPTLHVGDNRRTYLREGQLPLGRVIVSIKGHYTTLIDGVIHDTYDPSKNGKACVLGFWSKQKNT
jgi:hypothetical protein